MSIVQQQQMKARLKLADISILRKNLVAAYTRDIERQVRNKKIPQKDLPKVNSRMTDFKLFTIEEDLNDEPGICGLGWISLDMKTGEVRASSDKNNHAVDDICENSVTWNCLARFLKALPETKSGKTYGAYIAYVDEYMEDDMIGPSYTYYGDWLPISKRKINQKPVPKSNSYAGYGSFGRYYR